MTGNQKRNFNCSSVLYGHCFVYTPFCNCCPRYDGDDFTAQAFPSRSLDLAGNFVTSSSVILPTRNPFPLPSRARGRESLGG